MEFLFFLGLTGSAVVVLISFVEDAKELIGKEEHPGGIAEEGQSAHS